MKKRNIFGLNPNIFFLGLVSLLTDVSSEMIFTLLPLFLANILGAAPVIIGLIEGVAESTASLLKFASGWLSDRLGKRKNLAFLGYILSTIVKPIMYFATTWSIALCIRFTDRVGKGIRTAPRDALVADSVSINERGKAFGVHRAMDTLGAALGLLGATIVVLFLQGDNLKLTLDTYQYLVLIGTVPAIIALFFFIFVRDAKQKKNVFTTGKLQADVVSIPSHQAKTGFDMRFKIFLVLIFVFTLGNSSDAFLVLRTQNLGNPVHIILMMLILFNIVSAVLSTPAGVISDKLGRKRVLVIGWLIYAITYLGFACAKETWHAWILFGVYGIYQGLADGVTRAYVADLVPESKRGTAYGVFHGIVGITLLPASLIAGWLWQIVSPSATFYFGAGLSFIALIGFLLLSKK